MKDDAPLIGRVTRCSTRGFVGAMRTPDSEIPVFGGFCKADSQGGKTQVIGLIYNIGIEDDDLTRQLAVAEGPSQEELADQQWVRQIPVEFAALAVGYQSRDAFHYTLPPQPPFALAPVRGMSPPEVIRFTTLFDFLPLIFSAPNLPVDDLAAASIRMAAAERRKTERDAFLVEAGRYCAKLLSHDFVRLENLLRNLKMEMSEE